MAGKPAYPHILLQVSQQMALSVRNIPQYQHKGRVVWMCVYCETINSHPFFTQGEMKRVEVRGMLPCASCLKVETVHAVKVQL